MPRAKTRTPQLRDHVVRVALDTLAKEGVAGFTTRRVAADAATSTPAVYELFGDKAGLVRELFFEGFRLLRRDYDALDASDDPVEDLVRLSQLTRTFALANPELVQVMFSQPFADFDPGPDEARAGSEVRELIVGHVRRGIESGQVVGDATDIAHGLLALTLGLAGAELASRLGTSRASIDRRWDRATRALLRGYGPSGEGTRPRTAQARATREMAPSGVTGRVDRTSSRKATRRASGSDIT
jgi:AcrR family transcriptional regulator